MDRHQISRFTRQPKLQDGFREAVFFFTDDSWQELTKQMTLRSGGDADATAHAFQQVTDWHTRAPKAFE